MKKKLSSLMFILVAGILAFSLSAYSPAPAVNQLNGVQVTRTPLAQAVNTQLALSLQRENNWLMRENLHLTQANQAISKIQNLIDKAQAAGYDVTALNSALATFTSEIATAQGTYSQAAAILSTPAGFSGGQVTDAQVAHQTLASARDQLQQTHLTLVNASLSLRTALLNWRVQNNIK